MKKTLSIILAVLMVITALPLTAITSFAATSGDFEYSVISEEDKTCEITKYKASAINLSIPSTLDGYNVISIGWDAFKYCALPGSVTIPDSVTSIGGWAFSHCTGLASVTIPDNVTFIGSGAFSHCIGLASINVSEDNTAYSSVDGVLFNKAQTELIQYSIGNARTTYTIPDSVTSIGDYAFSGCYSLTSITIPDSVTSIGKGAFFDCTSLASITIPDSVTSIGESAFECCTSLASITIPDSVTSIGESAFSRCTLLASVTIGNSVTSIGKSAFDSCISLTSITIPDSVTSIGDYAFSRCTLLASVTIGNSVTSIGNMAFEDCTSLTDVYYTGTEEQWNAIEIGISNECLTSAKWVKDNQVWFYLGLIVAILIIVAIITWLVLSRRKRKNGNKQVD